MERRCKRSMWTVMATDAKQPYGKVGYFTGHFMSLICRLMWKRKQEETFVEKNSDFADTLMM